jgi:virulence factor Mce-like protein
MRNRQNTSLLGSPILIGSVTTLVTLITVFLSYNANEGLPYVPTYDISVRLPNAQGLVEGNEVRVGGKRVGVVSQIRARPNPNGAPEAELALNLDQTSQPVYSQAHVIVRPRSPLGLKYLELTPVHGGKPLAEGDTLPVSRSRPSVDLDQVVDALNPQTRRSLQLAVTGLGGGLAGRGEDLNAAIGGFPPLLRHARNVTANLADPATRLRGFIDGAARAAGELAPVARQLGSLVRASSVTAGALASVAPQLRDSITGLPPAELEATRTLAVARPVLRDSRVLVHELRPGTRVLAPAATQLHEAIVTGIPVVRRAIALSERLNDTLAALDRTASLPATRRALDRLLPTVTTLLPTLRFVVPAQTVCNILGLWTRNVDSTISEGDSTGTWFRTLVVLQADEIQARAKPSPGLHENQYGNTAAPGQTHECETGNEPYLPGQRIGHVPGNQGARTENTAPPAGVGAP